MSEWLVRAHYPSGAVEERFATEAEARAAAGRHAGVPVGIRAPAGAGPPVPDRCSFCGKQRAQVEGLVAGPTGAGVAICKGCAELGLEIMGRPDRSP